MTAHWTWVETRCNNTEQLQNVSGIRRYNLQEFTSVIYRNCYCKKMQWTPGRLRDAVRRKRPQKWRSNSWFLLHDNAPAHGSVLVKDFLSKINVTTLQLTSTCSDWNQHLRDGAFVLLLTPLRMRRKSWKGFHKTASRQAEVYSCTIGLFWTKCSFNDRTVLYFSDIKWSGIINNI